MTTGWRSEKYQEGAPSLGKFRQVNMEGGGGDLCFRNVPSGSSAGGLIIWVKDMGVVGGNEKILRGSTLVSSGR